MSARARDQLDLAILEHREWIEKSGEYARTTGSQGSGEKLGGDHFTCIKIIGSDLHLTALWHATRGLLRLLDGDAAGWQAIDTATTYNFWTAKTWSDALRLCAAYGPPWDIGYTGTRDTRLAAHLLCYALLLSLDSWRSHLWDALIATTATVAADDPNDWRKRVYEPFVMRLYQKSAGVQIPPHADVCRLGPYEGLFADWNNPAALVGPLTAICDYHCENMIDKGGEEEFDETPFDLYPVEILAIYKVRERLGLETPRIDHPILATPLASLEPREATPIDDPILNRVEKLHGEFFAKHPLPPVSEFKPIPEAQPTPGPSPFVKSLMELDPNYRYDPATGEYKFSMEAVLPEYYDLLLEAFSKSLANSLIERAKTDGMLRYVLEHPKGIKVLVELYRECQDSGADFDTRLTELLNSSNLFGKLKYREGEPGVRTNPEDVVVELPRLWLSHFAETSDAIRGLLREPAVAEVAADLWRRCEATGENFEGRLLDLINSPEKLSTKLAESVDAYEKFVRDPRLLKPLLTLFQRSQADPDFSSLLMRFADAAKKRTA